MKIAAFCLSWILILSAPGVMAQQNTTPNQSSTTPNQSWDVLRQLRAGEKLRVEKKAGKKKVSGEFISLSDTELVIERKGKTVNVGHDEVKKVWRVIPPIRSDKAKATALGGGLGALLGLISALGTCQSGCDDAEMAAAWASSTVVGALIGYFTQRDERTLIYSAP